MERINRYETIFVVDASLPNEEIQAAHEKFVKWLQDHGATIIADVDWGRKKFAYPIQKKWHGHYYVVEFDARPDIIADLETEYRRDDRILRWITTRLDKYAIEWNERWRQRLQEQKGEQEKTKRKTLRGRKSAQA